MKDGIALLADDIQNLSISPECNLIREIYTAIDSIPNTSIALFITAPPTRLCMDEFTRRANKIVQEVENVTSCLQATLDSLQYAIRNVQERDYLRQCIEYVGKKFLPMVLKCPTMEIKNCYHKLLERAKSLPNHVIDLKKITNENFIKFDDMMDAFSKIEFTSSLFSVLTKELSLIAEKTAENFLPYSERTQLTYPSLKQVESVFKDVVKDKNTPMQMQNFEKIIRISYYLMYFSKHSVSKETYMPRFWDALHVNLSILFLYTNPNGLTIPEQNVHKTFLYYFLFCSIEEDICHYIRKTKVTQDVLFAINAIITIHLYFSQVSMESLAIERIGLSENEFYSKFNTAKRSLEKVERNCKWYAAVKGNSRISKRTFWFEPKFSTIRETSDKIKAQLEQMHPFALVTNGLQPNQHHQDISDFLKIILTLPDFSKDSLEKAQDAFHASRSDIFQSKLSNAIIECIKNEDQNGILYHIHQKDFYLADYLFLKLKLINFFIAHFKDSAPLRLISEFKVFWVDNLFAYMNFKNIQVQEFPCNRHFQIMASLLSQLSTNFEDLIETYHNLKSSDSHSLLDSISYLYNIARVFSIYYLVFNKMITNFCFEDNLVFCQSALLLLLQHLDNSLEEGKGILPAKKISEIDEYIVTTSLSCKIHFSRRFSSSVRPTRILKNELLVSTSLAESSSVSSSQNCHIDSETGLFHPNQAPLRFLAQDDPGGWIVRRAKRNNRRQTNTASTFEKEQSLQECAIRHNVKNFIPDAVRAVLVGLNSHGYQAYIRGGMLPSILLRKRYFDIDIVTDCPPEKFKELFSSQCTPSRRRDDLFHVIGIRSDIVCVPFPNLASEAKEAKMSPSLYFIKTIAQKSDLTINCFFADAQERIYDPLGYIATISHPNLILCHPASESLKEDPQKILRMFSASLTFGKAILNGDLTVVRENISRIFAIPFGIYLKKLERLFFHGSAARAFILLHKTNLFSSLFYMHGQTHRDATYVGAHWLDFFSQLDNLYLQNAIRITPYDLLAYCLANLHSSSVLFWEHHFRGPCLPVEISLLNQALERHRGHNPGSPLSSSSDYLPGYGACRSQVPNRQECDTRPAPRFNLL